MKTEDLSRIIQFMKDNFTGSDISLEISSAGCGFPNKKCYCCEKFGYHRAKVTHKASGISSEVVQIIRELPPKSDLYSGEIESPKKLAMEDLERKLRDRLNEKNKEPMRVFEDNYDLKILPGMHIVARLDGRSFSSLTKKMNFKKPFDDKFNEIMVSVVKHLMKESGFNIIYGYTQSDEISLLFERDTDTFKRRVSKYQSVLASIASSVFTSISGEIVSFDCRISQLPSVEHVIEYFNWRQNDAHRNALNGYCYWKLRETHSSSSAVRALNGKNVSEMNEILFRCGINYNDVETWHKRGTGFLWSKILKDGINPITGEKEFALRNVLRVETELPCDLSYGRLISSIISIKSL